MYSPSLPVPPSQRLNTKDRRTIPGLEKHPRLHAPCENSIDDVVPLGTVSPDTGSARRYRARLIGSFKRPFDDAELSGQGVPE